MNSRNKVAIKKEFSRDNCINSFSLVGSSNNLRELLNYLQGEVDNLENKDKESVRISGADVSDLSSKSDWAYLCVELEDHLDDKLKHRQPIPVKIVRFIFSVVKIAIVVLAVIGVKSLI